MQEILPWEDMFRGRRVLVTGHTGFTGTWAVHWLSAMGAEVHGLSLVPQTQPNIFEATGAQQLCATHKTGDIRSLEIVCEAVAASQPAAVLHLAAQPLVRRSYADPVETFSTNVMGTVHVLEAARRCDVTRGVVCITTDKVYDNREDGRNYREEDRLGGKDPYSASKACAELAVASYRSSLGSWEQDKAIVSVRGGNIIGGGDWSEDRLIPDFARAASTGASLSIRNPAATRPWQHVLCLVHGYLLLLARVLGAPQTAGSAWNLGPTPEDCVSVGQVVELLQQHWIPVQVNYEEATLHEVQLLMIDSTRARAELAWRPGWSLEEAISATARWYGSYYADPSCARDLCEEQVEAYRRAVLAVTTADAVSEPQRSASSWH